LTAPKPRGSRQADGVKSDAIETHEARICREPDIAVLGLGYRIDAIGWKAVLLQPRPAIVLVDVLVGIQREATDGGKKKEQQHSHQQWATRPLARFRKSIQLKTTESSA
jgi:hypothetical protein